MTLHLKTDEFAAHLRRRVIDVPGKRLLISRLSGSEQERDLTEPPNCRGYGRVRHFRRFSTGHWPRNPLPLDPACRALGLESVDLLRAQVFQSSACDWRCWYCFVPFRLLDGRSDEGAWLSAQDLLDLYMSEAEEQRPAVIDLSGGQPDLVPEWVPWMMAAIRERGLEGRVYLWSDDNLSNDYFWRYLSDDQQALVSTFNGYGRVACFKGYDEKSFAFNTNASPGLFARQFDVFRRLLETGVDLYAYATLTTPDVSNVDVAMARFVDGLQRVHELLPLRTVPLEIVLFRVVRQRLDKMKLPVAGKLAVEHQRLVVDAWLQELERRFSVSERSMAIVDVPMRMQL